MKNLYVITYAYKGSPAKYQGLYDAIKTIGAWWHYIDNSWLVCTEKSARQIWDGLQPYVDGDINLLVFELGKDRQGWLPKEAWEWIRTHSQG